MKEKILLFFAGLRRKEKILLLFAGLFALAGMVLTAVRTLGVRFSGLLFLGAALFLLLLILLDRWSEKSKTGRRCRAVFLSLSAAVFLLLCAMELRVVAAARAENSKTPVCAVVVLGAGVNGRTPSLTLQTRLNAALAYLADKPDLPIVLSGGQGPGEDLTEAEAMRNYLTARGIAEERLILEEKSTNTEENLRYSKALLEQNGVDTKTAALAVVTSDFHICRSRILAKNEGLNAVGVGAQLPYFYLELNYFVREAFALTALLATQLFFEEVAA